MKRINTHKLILKIVNIALLSALGIVLMLYVKLPYPLAPYLEIEISDTVILVGYATTGFLGALFICIIKTLISLLAMPVGIYFIGQLAALISSLTYLIMLFLFVEIFRFFSKEKHRFLFRLLAYICIGIVNSLVMTSLNYLFITPTYLTGEYVTCFDSKIVEQITHTLQTSLNNPNLNYFQAIFVLYLPFNLLKSSLVLAVYEILFNSILFLMVKNNPKIAKYIMPNQKSKDDRKGDNSK